MALQWYTKVKFVTEMTMSYGVSSTAIKKDVWDKMSKADTDAVKKSLRAHANKLRSTVRLDNKRAHKAIVRAGVKVTPTPAAATTIPTTRPTVRPRRGARCCCHGDGPIEEVPGPGAGGCAWSTC